MEDEKDDTRLQQDSNNAHTNNAHTTMLTQQCSHNNAPTRLKQQDSNNKSPTTRLQQYSNKTPTRLQHDAHSPFTPPPLSSHGRFVFSFRFHRRSFVGPNRAPFVSDWLAEKKNKKQFCQENTSNVNIKNVGKKHLSSGRGRGTFSPGHIDTAVNETAFGNAFGHFRHDKNPKPILGANALFLFFGDFRNLFLRLNLISH
jgi:hypothetical protein